MHRFFRWEGYAFALVLTTTLALAETPSYTVKGVYCQGRACTAIVTNSDGFGMEVLGARRTQAVLAAQAKADELNATPGTPEGLTPVCTFKPDLCEKAGI